MDKSTVGFTPGPWRFEEGVNEYGHQQEGAPVLGTVRGSGEKPDGGEHIAVCVADLTEAEANARLIAAAPELYDHLEWLLNSYDLGVVGAERTEKLLAKARGETPNASALGHQRPDQAASA